MLSTAPMLHVFLPLLVWFVISTALASAVVVVAAALGQTEVFEAVLDASEIGTCSCEGP